MNNENFILILSLKNVYFKFHQCLTTLKYKVKYVWWAHWFSTSSSDTYVYKCLLYNVIDNY